MIKSVSESPACLILPVKPLLIVISGPSGVGKDAILNRMKVMGCPFSFIVTATTRPRREREKDGVDYHFFSERKFREMIQNGEFLEHARVYGNWYGVPKAQVKKALGEGKDVVMKVDIQGAATIKKIVPQAVFIFLVPPSMEELIERLNNRCTESPADLALRTSLATEEMKQLPSFDYVVVNRKNKIDKAIAEITAIVTAEKCRTHPREINL